MKRKSLLFVFLFIVIVASAQEKIDGIVVNRESVSSVGAVDDYIHLYQDFLSPLKQGMCAMYPSCSNYGLIVYENYPFLKATTLLSDRLIRCSHDQSMYDKASVYGKTSCIDFPPCSVIPDSIASSGIPKVHTDVLRYHSNDTLLFVNHLVNKEEYQNAMYVIQKAEFENKGLSAELEAKKLLCYRALRRYEDGVFEYETQMIPNYKQFPDISLQASLLYY